MKLKYIDMFRFKLLCESKNLALKELKEVQSTQK